MPQEDWWLHTEQELISTIGIKQAIATHLAQVEVTLSPEHAAPMYILVPLILRGLVQEDAHIDFYVKAAMEERQRFPDLPQITEEQARRIQSQFRKEPQITRWFSMMNNIASHMYNNGANDVSFESALVQEISSLGSYTVFADMLRRKNQLFFEYIESLHLPADSIPSEIRKTGLLITLENARDKLLPARAHTEKLIRYYLDIYTEATGAQPEIH